MIALALAAAGAAAVAPPAFAPPVGEELRYTVTERHPLSRGGEAVITSHERLRFDRGAVGRLVATLTLDGADVAAPPAPQMATAIAANALRGVPLRIVVDAGGVPGDVLEPEAGWRAIAAGLDALEAALAADADLPPADLAADRAMLAAERAQPPSVRAERLLTALAPLLPPPLPTLRRDEVRALATVLPSPAAPLAATGTLRLDGEAPAAEVRYRSAITSDPAAGVQAAAALRARLGAVPEAERARLRTLADALAQSIFRSETMVAIDRATGLLNRTEERQIVRDAGGAEHLILARTIVREP